MPVIKLMCISGYYIAIQRSLDKELPSEREFVNFVDRYAVVVKKDSSDNVPSGFESSFGSNPAHFIANYSSKTLYEEPHEKLSHKEK